VRRFAIQSTIAAGTYLARFLGVEDTNHVEYGPGVRFVFEILEGLAAGRRVSRVTSTRPTPHNSAGRILAGLVGRHLAGGELVDVDVYVGMTYRIDVESTAAGVTRVEAVYSTNPQ